LLHADDLPDVLDLAAERAEFLEDARPFLRQMIAQCNQVGEDLFALRVTCEVVAQRQGMLVQQGSNSAYVADERLVHGTSDQSC
jgi:hypothetical protein